MTNGVLPSLVETEFYLKDVLDEIIEKNTLVWSKSIIYGDVRYLDEGLVTLSDTDSLIFFKKRTDETIYKFYILSKEEKVDSMLYYFNKFKKLKTIS